MDLVNDFNDADINQSKQYVEIPYQKDTERAQNLHGWKMQSKNEQTSAIKSLSTEKPISPIPSDANDKVYTSTGTLEGTKEYKLLSEKFGFLYRTLLDKLICCCVIS